MTFFIKDLQFMPIGFRKLLLILLILGSLKLSAQENTAIIYGTVSDSTSKPLIGATITLFGSNTIGTFTDSVGKYELAVPANRNDTIVFTYIGLGGSFSVIKPPAKQKTKLDKKLFFSSTNLKPYEFLGDKVPRGGGMTPVNPKLADIITGPSGNGVEALIKTLPGVTSNNELSSQFNVRGGNFDENLLYVNDIEIHRPFLIRSGQQEGLSFVNSDMVSDVLFSAGGFNASYGDKMSSVLDVKYKRPIEFAGSVSASLLGESLSLEGTAAKGHRFTYLIGARQKSNQYILSSLDTKGDYKPKFTDVQAFFTYDISDKWEVELLGNYSQNQYKVVPSNRLTSFGTFSQALGFQVFFDGQELDSYQTITGAVSLVYHPTEHLKLKFITSEFNSVEDETYDIEGQFYLNQLNTNLGSSQFGNTAFNLGVGTFINHARDYLNANVYNFEHKGFYTYGKNELQWGAGYQREIISDNLNEWNYVDSAGYSIPIQPDTMITLQNPINITHNLSSNRISGYIQNKWEFGTNTNYVFTAGVRANYWDVNNQTVYSPRANLTIKPHWKKDFVFRIASGIYNQPPFFRELLDLNGNLHKDVKAQESIHFVAGTDYNFRAWGRPFKFTAEAYYKILNNIDPYFIDDVRIRYFGNNSATGFAEGIDFRVNGEFVKDIESWASLSIMQTRETIANNIYYNYYNSDGQQIIPGQTLNTTPVYSVKNTVGSIPRPADQRISLSIFFQDYLPRHPSYKMNLNLVFGTGFPFGPPNSERFMDAFRMPFYRRVDVGFSKQIISEGSKLAAHSALFRHIKSMWISLEVFNLLDVSNTISYTWIQDASGIKYAVPNYLTSRQLNAKLYVKF